MSGLLNIISRRIERIDFSQPFAMFDLVLALFLVVSLVLYMRRYPLFRVILGVAFLLILSLGLFFSGFVITSLVIGSLANISLFALPLIFAPEIRHYLEKIGRFPFLKLPRLTNQQKKEEFISKLSGAVYEMAERKVGGTIVLARKTGLGQTIETGVVLNANFDHKLLQNIFFPKSPLHDGAVIIQHQRIFAAGCLLPINGDIKLDPPFGTRHRSGLAITKDTDAVVILISEQRGHVTLAENGKMHINLDRKKLNKMLEDLL